MKRLLPALAVLLLLTACSSQGVPKALGATPAPTPSSSAKGSPTAGPLSSPGPPVPAGFAPLSATFVSDRTGWVLGCVDSCGDGLGGYVLARTRDAGRTWEGLAAPKAPLRSLTGLRFANLQDGFAYGADVVWTTHDGGATWRAQRMDGPVAALEAARGQVWALVTDGAAGTVYASLLRRPVAGGAWAHVRDLRVSGGDVPQLVLQGTTQLVTADSSPGRIGLLVGDGAAFVQRRLPCTPDLPFAALAAQSEQRLLVVCHRGDGNAGQEPKVAWVSTDQGRTWRQAAEPSQMFPTFVAATQGSLFVGGQFGVSVSRDGGKSWSSSLFSDQHDVSEIGFEGPHLGFALGGFDLEPGMRITRDDGRTWHAVDFSRTT